MLIATIPIPNKALDLLLDMRYFIGYLYLLNSRDYEIITWIFCFKKKIKINPKFVITLINNSLIKDIFKILNQ